MGTVISGLLPVGSVSIFFFKVNYHCCGQQDGVGYLIIFYSSRKYLKVLRVVTDYKTEMSVLLPFLFKKVLTFHTQTQS